MSETLPPRANLDWYRKAAKKKLKVLRSHNAAAKLAEAQLAIAREQGFASWRKLLAAIEAQPRGSVATETKAAWSVDRLPAHRRSHKIAQWKPIMDAAFAGDAAKVAALLDAGADPNVISSTPHRHRPLHRAIERKKSAPRDERHLAVVKLLLERGADPHQRGTHAKHTALQLAAIDSPRFVPLLRDRFKPFDLWHAVAVLNVARVKALLSKDPSLASARDENQWTPLHYCAASAMYELGATQAKAQAMIATALLSAGADVNATYLYNSEWPISVLFYACGYHDNPQLTESLMQAGANPCDGESVYHASDEKHAACLEVLERLTNPKKLAIECTRCLATQFHWGHSAGAKWLLEHGADPNSLYPKTGRSALHAACENGASEAVIRLLLRHGANPQRKTSDGLSAIDLAKRKGKGAIIERLTA